MLSKETDRSRMNTSLSEPAPHAFKPVHTRIFRKVSLWVAVPLALVALFSVYQKPANWDVGTVFVIAIVVGCVLLAFGFAWAIVTIARRTTALAIEGDRLVYQAWGRTRSWPLADVTKLVRGTVLVENLEAPSYSNEHLMFINGSGRCLLRLGPQWAHTQIAHAIGLAIQPIDASVMTAGDAARLYPGSYSWIVAHPLGRYGVGIATGVVLVIAISLFITWFR
jgi:hypothetical protein